MSQVNSAMFFCVGSVSANTKPQILGSEVKLNGSVHPYAVQQFEGVSITKVWKNVSIFY